MSTIAPIVNGSYPGVCGALARYRKRWKFKDEKYYGRVRGFLSDFEIEEIRKKYTDGETIANIAKDCELTYSMVYGIVTGRSYTIKENDGFPFDFNFRPNRRLL